MNWLENNRVSFLKNVLMNDQKYWFLLSSIICGLEFIFITEYLKKLAQYYTTTPFEAEITQKWWP